MPGPGTRERRASVVVLGALGAVIALTACSARAATSAPAAIEDGPEMRRAGVHEFAVTPRASSAGATTWRLDREATPTGEGEDDSSDGDNGNGHNGNGGDDAAAETSPVATAAGPSARFDLPAVDGAATTYLVTASGDGFSDVQRVQVFPTGTVSEFVYRSPGNPDVPTQVVVPSTLSRATHVLMVMHGTGRNAEEYCETWAGWSERHDYLVLCPTFSEEDWPGSAAYNLGNVFSEDDDGGARNPERAWSFTVAAGVHRFADQGFALADTLFDMWGHSAGAQFVHRFSLYKPEAPLRFAIAANAGWYTTPNPQIPLPYGLADAEVAAEDWTRQHLVIMRGQWDTERDGNLRVTPEADAQGPHRYARAGHMYRAAMAIDPQANWQLIDVPGAGHDQAAMAPTAQRFLLEAAPRLPFRRPLPAGDPCS